MKLALIGKRETLRDIERLFQLTFVAADNYTTGGVTVDFTALVNSISASRANIPVQVSGGKPPAASAFRVNQVPQGYDGEMILNTSSPTLKNYLFKITSSGGTEIAASGIPSGIYGDVNGFTFSVVTPKKYG